MPDDERELLSRSQRGDREAFGKMVESYQLRVYNLVLRMVGNRVAAEDLTQESFLRAHVNIQRFDLERRFLPWIFKIASNLARNYLKASARKELPLFTETLAGSKGPDPVRVLEAKDFISRVESELMTLPFKYREPLVLKEVEGLSYREIKEILDLPVWVLKMRVSRARAKLRERMKQWEQESG